MNISWLKLDVNILDNSKIKIIRSHPEGDTIVLLWIGILCLAMKSSRPGTIEISDGIPYSIDDLSSLFNIDKKTVELGIVLLCKYQMIEVFNGGCIEVINFAKNQSLELLDRKRELTKIRTQKYRENLRQIPLCDAPVTRHSVTVTPTEEIRGDKIREESAIAKISAKRFQKPTIEELTEYCRLRNNGIDPQYFLDYQDARGWLIGGKSPIKNWKAAMNTWERNNRNRNNVVWPKEVDPIEIAKQNARKERSDEF